MINAGLAFAKSVRYVQTVSEPAKSRSDELRERVDIVPPLAPPDVFDPVTEAYKKDVDRTLIRENLKLTHEQRLRKLQDFVKFFVDLRNQNAGQGRK